MGRTSIRLSPEIAPRLDSGGRLLAVGQLHRLLHGEQGRWSRTKGQALLLAAFNYQFSLRLVGDLGLSPCELVTPRRWRWQLKPRVERVLATNMVWPGLGSALARPLPRTRSFIGQIPEGMVQEILNWAPPVVQSPGPDGTSRVVANHLSALLARHLLPDQRVPIRRLRHTSSLQRPLPEVCQGIAHALEPLYAQHRQRIAELAPDEHVAYLLTGYSRAQYFRIRDGGHG